MRRTKIGTGSLRVHTKAMVVAAAMALALASCGAGSSDYGSVQEVADALSEEFTVEVEWANELPPDVAERGAKESGALTVDDVEISVIVYEEENAEAIRDRAGPARWTELWGPTWNISNADGESDILYRIQEVIGGDLVEVNRE